MLDGFGDGGQGAGPVPGVGLLVGQVVQRPGQVGQVGGGVGLGQRRRMLDGFGDGGQGPGPVAGVGLLDGQVVQRRGEVGQVGGGVGLGERRGSGRRLR